jgi:hypothetical protein
MPKVDLKDLVQDLPLRTVCRIWDKIPDQAQPMKAFLADACKFLHVDSLQTAEQAVDTMYKQFSQNKLEGFMRILNFHLRR